MTHTGTIGTVLLAVFLVASAATAVATDPDVDEQNVVATELGLRTISLLGEGNLWDGSQTFGYIYVELCWDPGGFNPTEEDWTVKLEIEPDWPDWMVLDYPTESQPLQPALLGSSAEQECGDEVEFEVVLNSEGEIDYEHTHAFNFDIVVEGPDTIGTYNKPDDQAVTLSITTDEEPEEMFPEDDDGDENEGDGDGGTQGDTEEGPAPVIAVFALLTVGIAALVRRRR